MKYIIISEGLGNQMFKYAFFLSVKEKVPALPYFALLKKNYTHRGYDIRRVFGIKRFETAGEWLANYKLVSLQVATKLFPLLLREKIYRFFGFHDLREQYDFLFHGDVFDFRHKDEIFTGLWQSYKYFAEVEEKVRQCFEFRLPISQESKTFLADIESCNSVSVHIRRGDYLQEKYSALFGNICTADYYERAISYMKQNTEKPVFFVFTDDTAWAKTAFPEARTVDCNTGKNSWQDMCLMSRCRHHIIANSTFGWWGAWLNTNPDKTVVAPARWCNAAPVDDVIPEDWVRL